MILADLIERPFPENETRCNEGWEVLDALPIQVAALDEHGAIVECNDAWRSFGLPGAGGAILSAWENHVTEPLVRSTLYLGIRELIAGSRTSFELEYPARLGTKTVWLALRAYPYPEGTVVTQTDITTRRLAEAQHAEEATAARVDHALARAGAELIATLDLPETLDRLCQLTTELLDCDSSHTLFWHAEDDSYTTASSYGEPAENAEAIRHMRLPSEAFTGAIARGADVNVAEVILAEQPTRLHANELGIRRLLQISLRRGDRRIGFQTACRRSDRPFTKLEESVATRLGQLASLAIENARLMGQFNEAVQLKSEFVATVSHELRTPIHVVLGFADLLLDGAFGAVNKEQGDALMRILFGARSLLEMSEATLQLNRLDEDDVQTQIDDFDLADLLKEAEAEVRKVQRDTTVPIETRLAPGLERLRTDRQKLKVVIKNLLSNGLKFTEQGFVRISAEARADEVFFVVEDTGVGIKKEALSTIFDAFRQADGSAARRYGGIGLGLHLVRRIVERLGGSVRAKSTPGEGSRFEVTFPLEAL